MYAFDYHKPRSLAEAAEILAAKPEARVLAGGMTLIPALKQRLASPGDLVDLAGIGDLVGIAAQDTEITIGAMTPHAAVAHSELVTSRIPALAALAEGIGDPQVRNRGTIGGSVSNADPAADYPAALLGLGAVIDTDQRSIAADDFFTGMFETALARGEIVRQVRFPIPRIAGYAKYPNPASRYAVVGVFVARTRDGVRVAVTGARPSAFRVPEMELLLTADFSEEAISDIRLPPDDLNSDPHATSEYRAQLITVMARRAVATAIRSAEAGGE
jgi:carbon-monoxide dehydrogenase medium subunit